MPVVTGIQLKIHSIEIVWNFIESTVEWILIFHIVRFHTIKLSGISMDSAKIHDIKFGKSVVYGKYFDTVYLQSLFFSTVELKARKGT